jgi:DNA N-6-adenine-methyltransferase (Dam)
VIVLLKGVMTTASSDTKAPANLAAAEAVLKANIGPLRHWTAEQPSSANSAGASLPTATQIAAVVAVASVIVTATKQQAGWARLRLKALRELGKFLLRTPYLKGRPPKVSTADTLPSLAKLGIKDRRIAWRAIQVARVDENLFQQYLTTDEPTEKGLLRHALCETVPQDAPLHREASRDENYSEMKTENVVSPDPDSGGTRRFTRGGYLGLATTGSEEWYTPTEIFEALGCRFDLDVASPGADVVHWIPADRHFTVADNGLERDWGDAYVWCNAPFSREGLPLWMEKFRRHGNGIAMIGDRTSTGVWQDVCGNADLSLLVNKKVNFISPNSGPGNNTLGSTLVAYGERAVQALMNAEAAGLGTLFKPCPSVPTSGNADLRSPQAAEAGEREIRRVEHYSESERYWLTPPELLEQLRAEFGDLWDACPYPRPVNYNSLEVPWGQVTYCNGPFSARRDPEGHGPTDFARKAIEENKLGKTIVIPLPTFNYVNMLLEARAEARPLGRVRWLEATTGQPHPAPPFITLFILRGKPK